jgi:predicted Zn-dependent peptidase
MRDIDEIEKVTAADVQRVVKKYMAPELATVVFVPPKGAVPRPEPAPKPTKPTKPATKGGN